MNIEATEHSPKNGNAAAGTNVCQESARSVKKGIREENPGRYGSKKPTSQIRLKVFRSSADSGNMRDLLYRLPRFSAEFPVDVIVGEVAILGVCKNISENGMRGEFRKRLPIDTEGLIRLNHPQQTMELRGRVVHYAQYQMAFHFIFQSETERKKLSEFARMANVVGATLKTAAPPARGLRYLPMPTDRRHR